MSTVEEVRLASEAFRVKQLFDKHDNDQSGELSVIELKELMHEVWQDTNEKLLTELLKSMDTDGNGEVSWEEFCHMMNAKAEHVGSKLNELEEEGHGESGGAGEGDGEGKIRAQEEKVAT